MASTLIFPLKIHQFLGVSQAAFYPRLYKSAPCGFPASSSHCSLRPPSPREGRPLTIRFDCRLTTAHIWGRREAKVIRSASKMVMGVNESRQGRLEDLVTPKRPYFKLSNL
ncbi:hypothetical protein NPIL_390511 [Nephila pilipes]|uniref:Uncharacterized protein n=1 Tax=Nephila pilipes TaxID=299642 RepID=A0A8X6TIU3_NEPPI|nr:hypothetical protein NPIL_390511 [Nephila pilipes]